MKGWSSQEEDLSTEQDSSLFEERDYPNSLVFYSPATAYGTIIISFLLSLSSVTYARFPWCILFPAYA